MNIVWFALVGVLFIGFFLLEGISYGAGIMLPMMAKKESERKDLYAIVGPGWRSSQMWVILMAFLVLPHQVTGASYGMYIALSLLTILLFLRGIAFKMRKFDGENESGSLLDKVLWLEGTFSPLLWGIIIGSFLEGKGFVPCLDWQASFFSMFGTYGLLLGATLMFLCIFYGALYTSISVKGQLKEKSRATALVMGVILALLLTGLATGTKMYTNIFADVMVLAVYAVGMLAFMLAWFRARQRAVKSAFLLSILFVILFVGAFVFGSFETLQGYLLVQKTIITQNDNIVTIFLGLMGISYISHAIRRWFFYKNNNE